MITFWLQLKFEGFIRWQMLSNSGTFSFKPMTFGGEMVLELSKTKIGSDVQRADNSSNSRREVGDEERCVITVKGHVNHSNTHNHHPHWCTVRTDKHGWTHAYHGAVVCWQEGLLEGIRNNLRFSNYNTSGHLFWERYIKQRWVLLAACLKQPPEKTRER